MDAHLLDEILVLHAILDYYEKYVNDKLSSLSTDSAEK
jgi:hypothetical protein